MISEQLFGQGCLVHPEKEGQWIRIRCQDDGYEGWCLASHMLPIEQELPPDAELLTLEWSARIEFDGFPMMIPMGSSLKGLDRGRLYWGDKLIRYTGKLWNAENFKEVPDTIRQLSFEYLNTGYLWGGKSVYGTDCSGFTQTIFRFLNCRLPRDAWQQAGQGMPVDSLEESRCGDLAFFDTGEDRITHVGILLGTNEIIHASGKVRVDSIGKEGISQRPGGNLTHFLRCIRRMIP
jgi:hypothetical protein